MSSNPLVARIGARIRYILLRLTPRSRRFHRIYKDRLWGGKNFESASGAGSTLDATNQVREMLPATLKKIDCRVLLDLGCGDFNWMKEVPLSCQYIGADIVDELIEKNRGQYASDLRRFIVLDATRDKLPKNVDTVLCREVFFHLSHQDIKAVLRGIKQSNARYLIATNIFPLEENVDTFTGGFRPIDLRLPPFNLPEPLEIIPDHGVANNRYLCVWDIADYCS